MPGIYHDVTINAPPERVFAAVTHPEELNQWWTLHCEGRPESGARYRFYFGPQYNWYAAVKACAENHMIDWHFTQAQEDWNGTSLRFEVAEVNGDTLLRLEHRLWVECSDHFRRTSYCWAQYLRLLKIYVEEGIVTPYEERISA